ncbi:hypothetical protein PFICI_11721 [Pestalotiopsis fici W106-1]|uniref:Modin n=1 Tax=Pestalotiopsis fici (strain W106-1 / CGMCC3.15140) TaxID=1229662 RepID=W3WR70_PESFW|nr:uncharacterized protein PFICI_11721 [Pestalotiopsis fici W106-1]ETS76334.1 hypothetical protein PFICI_11721 [Pestalotiopsis fici W106-1]
MSSNDQSSSSSEGGDDYVELIVAVVALVISVLAFAIAILQALQQYLATATGFSSCSEAVIGKWAKFARRHMIWTEFRFEVQFEVPVIFVARPKNTKGPLGDEAFAPIDARIVRMDGSPDNFEYTDSVEEFDIKKSKKSTRQAIHTADNEKATWYGLLMAVCRMETESREWQAKKSAERRSTIGPRPPPMNPTPPDAPHHHHSLVVCMQRKRRTWDSMPKDFAKPYATTTISHIIEIAAILGIHWRIFDVNNHRYRAQGNGFVIDGSSIQSLGITFNFQKQGPTWFQKNRVVPNYNIKKLCFGIVPTIFKQDRVVYADEAKGVESLQLEDPAAIANTLVVFGCNNRTVNYFRKNLDQSRHSHLFAVAFELLGMVGEMLHVKDTVFRVLPNPTGFHWDPSTFSLPRLLNKYIISLKLLHGRSSEESEHLNNIINWAENVPEFSLLRAQESTPDFFREDPPGASLIDNLSHLRDGVELCDDYLGKIEARSPSMVKQIVRVHIQEIMRILHEEKKETDQGSNSNAITIHDIDSASAEKESLLIDMYFDRIRPEVVRIVREQAPASSQNGASQDNSGSINVSGETTDPSLEPSNSGAEDVDEVWCTLVFRMLCWLQLHTFHKMDIQVSKSDVYGSRIPVYIV